MNTVKYDRDITALLVIDPYNDSLFCTMGILRAAVSKTFVFGTLPSPPFH